MVDYATNGSGNLYIMAFKKEKCVKKNCEYIIYFLMALFYDMCIKFLCKAPSAKTFERMSEYKEEKICLVRNDG